MRWWWKVIHIFIIANFMAEILYGFYMVFDVVGGGRWPLFGRAEEVPVQVILKRRLYGVETWLAIVGLCLYLALTEILPRKLKEERLQGRLEGPEK
ncbi:MAG: hypothetical protein H5T69_09610 [Chloroflexi bacterium]|nr:hypothetical protein [Chloroflexota bacterium]